MPNVLLPQPLPPPPPLPLPLPLHPAVAGTAAAAADTCRLCWLCPRKGTSRMIRALVGPEAGEDDNEDELFLPLDSDEEASDHLCDEVGHNQ